MSKFFFSFILFVVGTQGWASGPVGWAKVQCEAVSQTEAQQFAEKKHFIDNFDFFTAANDAAPPFVAPAGTLKCELPLALWEVTYHGEKQYHADVQLHGVPFTLELCTVFYFDGRPSESFPARGSGSGSLPLQPSSVSNSVGVYFARDSRKHLIDGYLAGEVSTKASLRWVPEAFGYGVPHIPIVSRCSVKY